jgi:hypothetical protein
VPLLLLTPALVSAFMLQSTPANAAPVLVDQLANGSFEGGRTGWEAGAAGTRFRVVRGVGGNVAQLTTDRPTSNVVVMPRPGAVRTSWQGQHFVASAWMRSSQRGLTGRLAIIESAGSSHEVNATSIRLTRRWRKVSVRATADSAQTLVGVRVRANSLHRGQRVQVDHVRLRGAVVSAPAVSTVSALADAVTRVSASSSSASTAALTWAVTTNGHRVSGVYVGRNGVSSSGHTGWESSKLTALNGTLSFPNLRSATAYTLYAQPVVDGVRGRRVYATVTTKTATPTPALTPAPVTATNTQYGASSTGGSTVASVVSKFGTGASIRSFVPGGFASAAVRPAGTSEIHVSWKPAIGSVITDAQLITAFANLRDGDQVEVWHEADVKYRKGQDLAGMLAMKNQFHDKVVALRTAGRIPKVQTVNTWAGWTVDSTSGINPANLHARADLLGIDMDGIPAFDSFYPYATRQMGAKLVAAFKAGGYKGWTVPEFCMPSVSSDTDRTRRIAWFRSEVAKISQGVPGEGVPAPEMIAWFDTAGIIGESERLTTSNEITAWSALVSTN